MMRSRLGLFGVFAALLVTAWWTKQGQAQPGTVKEITKGVWFREGDIKNLGHCNNIIIEMKDYLIVVDANFPSGAKLAMADAKKLSSKPIKYVFDTHHHGDHAYGNAVWTQAGATTLAYVGVAEEMKRYEPKRWQETSKTRKDVGDLNLQTAEPPKQTFDKPTFVLDDGDRKVEFHYYGWAHTRGDGFVYLPKEQVLATGDAVANGPYNYLADGNVRNWPNVIAQTQKLKVKFVLPGHGGPGGPEVLAGQKLFMTELYAAVQKAQKSGKKIDDLIQRDGTKLTGTSVTLSPAVQNWASEGLAAKVKDTYEEIAGGKPHGDLPH